MQRFFVDQGIIETYIMMMVNGADAVINSVVSDMHGNGRIQSGVLVWSFMFCGHLQMVTIYPGVTMLAWESLVPVSSLSICASHPCTA